MASVFMAAGLCLAIVSATIDINIRQLQFIADHLDKNECKKLSQMLHLEELVINTTAITGEREPEKPCIFLLLKWDRTEGRSKTFNHLALRLRQLGRKDLSDFLSHAVYKEDDLKLKENFLNDPFKKNIVKDSVLLDNGKVPKRKKVTKRNDTEENLTSWELASVISGSVILFALLTYFTYKLFGTAIWRIFRNFAPDTIVAWCDMMRMRCKWCRDGAKRNYDTHLIGKKPKTLSVQERQSILELNRNLNNYMNGELEASSYLERSFDSWSSDLNSPRSRQSSDITL